MDADNFYSGTIGLGYSRQNRIYGYNLQGDCFILRLQEQRLEFYPRPTESESLVWDLKSYN